MNIGIRATILFLMVQIGIANAAAEYIDVHVHLRGAVKSGMLGNIDSKNKMGGPGPQFRRFGSPAFRRGGSNPKDPNGSLENNLKIAAKNLIRKMDEFGVKQALVVTVPGPNSNDAEYASIRKVVGEYPDRLKLMAGGARLSPYLHDIPPGEVTNADRSRFSRIATEILNDGAVGFGEMLSYHLSLANHHSFKYTPPDHPLFFLLADIAAKHNVPIDLHMEAVVKRRPIPVNLLRASVRNPRTLEPTIPAFERLLKHNRKAKIVWQHIGWDNTGDMTAKLVGRLMSRHPNLFIALRVERRTWQVGNGSRMPNRLVDISGTLKPEWLRLINKFSSRIIIGSDEFFFPVESRRPNQSFAETWMVLDQLPRKLANKLGIDNPRRIYNLIEKSKDESMQQQDADDGNAASASSQGKDDR